MGTIISRWRAFALSTSLFLIFAAFACGSDDAPAAPAPTQAVTDPTQVVTAPTQAVPTPTQAVPAPFVPATLVPPVEFVAPTVEALSDVSAGEAILLGLGELRPFPSGILNDAERLPRDEVIALWAEFLGDVRVIDNQNVNMVDICADGTGYFFSVTTQGLAVMAGESFDWEVLAAIGGRWNEPKIRITPADTSIVLDNFSGLPYNESILREPTEEDPGYGSATNKFIASLAHTPGILHADEADSVFSFSDSADTVCGG